MASNTVKPMACQKDKLRNMSVSSKVAASKFSVAVISQDFDVAIGAYPRKASSSRMRPKTGHRHSMIEAMLEPLENARRDLDPGVSSRESMACDDGDQHQQVCLYDTCRQYSGRNKGKSTLGPTQVGGMPPISADRSCVPTALFFSHTSDFWTIISYAAIALSYLVVPGV